HYQQFTQHARRRVKYLVMDMNAAYDQLVKTVFPCAQIIYDRFHIAKHLNDTMCQHRFKIVRNHRFKNVLFHRFKCCFACCSV
ncbi:transposase, partial [Limosilactobacillus albertensis]